MAHYGAGFQPAAATRHRMRVLVLRASAVGAAEAEGGLGSTSDGWPSTGCPNTYLVMASGALMLARAPVLFLLVGLGGAILTDDGGLWLTDASFWGSGAWMIRLTTHERIIGEVVR